MSDRTLRSSNAKQQRLRKRHIAPEFEMQFHYGRV
jgi:hypothetical protein